MRTFLTVFVFILSTPFFAAAHAIPVTTEPAASAILQEAPGQIKIRFSERIDAGASDISVFQDGIKISGPVRLQEARTLSAPLSGTNGVYTVAWSVVSSDDGHFTKGAFSFAVGHDVVLPAADASTEVVQIATLPESLAMTVELVGNGLIWAALLLFAFGIRPYLQTCGGTDSRLIHRGYTFFISLGAVFVFVGGAFQLFVKASDLAMIREIAISSAVSLYLQTAAGSATVYRSIAVAVLLVVFLFSRRRIVSSVRVTWYEGLLILCMLFFAYFRAVISHATANSFYPELSIAINFLHVIEKDVWAGIIGIFLVIVATPQLKHLGTKILPRVSRILSVNVAAVGVTACYIMWLHLKSFDNLFSTQWGSVFLQLGVAAATLIALRTYHVIAAAYRASLFSRLLPLSFGAECAAALLVVYFSSIVIITSPPLARSAHHSFESHENGVHVLLEPNESNESEVLLTVAGEGLQTPTLTIDHGGTELRVELRTAFENGYVFSSALIPDETSNIQITVPQEHGYDAHATFLVTKSDFVPHDEGRSFDFFTITMIGIGVAAALFAYTLYRITPQNEVVYSSRGAFGFVALAFFVTVLIIGYLAHNFATSRFANPYKFECERDGNMWHLMLPSYAGVPRVSTPQEGCMWGMGNYSYHFPDIREYRHVKSLPLATVSLDMLPVQSGVETRFTITLSEPDGSPARLFVDMEKLIHVIIVSEDQTEFAHIHPDDFAEPSEEDIENSTFTLSHTFPKAGRYLVAVDYAHGITLESKQFIVNVQGAPQQKATATYPNEGIFGGYSVKLKYTSAIAGEVTTLQYVFSKDGKPVENLEPYLSAPMHVAAVKNDFSAFVHAHGEVHPPGTPLPPVVVRDGKIIHPMTMYPPPYGPNIEAHIIFPAPGLYTIWGQFKAEGKVIPTAFTVRVES